jgi:hypothetical protein
MRVYAGVFADDRDRSNQLIDRALRTGTRADRNRARR